MKTKLRKIGNSKGIIIKKTTIDKMQFKDYVNLEEKGNHIEIKKDEE